MSESSPLPASTPGAVRRISAGYELLGSEEDSKAVSGIARADDGSNGLVSVQRFDFVGRMRKVFDPSVGDSSAAAVDPAGKRICDRAVQLLSNPLAAPGGPGSDPDAQDVEKAARLTARLQSRMNVMKINIDHLCEAEDMVFDDREVMLLKKKNIRFAQANYQSICERLDNTASTLNCAHSAKEIRQTLVETDAAMVQDRGEFHSHVATASNPASTAQSLVHVVVNKTVGVLPESVHESMKDAAVWIADCARGNAIARGALKVFAALGMFLAYAVPIALIVASVIFPPIAPITATLAGGATLACPFIACFCGELWKALRDKDTGPDTPDVVLRLQQH